MLLCGPKTSAKSIGPIFIKFSKNLCLRPEYMHKAILKISKIIIPVLAKILNFFHKLQCLYFFNQAVDFIWGLISRRGAK